MKSDWIRHCLDLAKEPADLYSGSRKILQNRVLVFDTNMDLRMEDVGFTKSKMSQLSRNYIHEESIVAASALWDEYRKRPKYRSVVVSCFGKLVKNHDTGGNSRGSKMGSCLLAVVITMIDRYTVDISLHYRTTEFYKKFPADLVFVWEKILSRFDLEGLSLRKLTCMFDNITAHPAYFGAVIGHLKTPLRSLREIQEADEYFFKWICRWTARYLVPGWSRGIAKFAQAVRTKVTVESGISPEVKKKLIPMLKKYGRPERSRFELPEGDEE